MGCCATHVTAFACITKDSDDDDDDADDADDVDGEAMEEEVEDEEGGAAHVVGGACMPPGPEGKVHSIVPSTRDQYDILPSSEPEITCASSQEKALSRRVRARGNMK